MSTNSGVAPDVISLKPAWPLALCAGLLGIGQNGLLVMMPQLVSMTGLSLSVWAGLLMFGSMLFLPGSPWWGRRAEIRGCKFVVVAALTGYLASFTLMALTIWGMALGAVGLWPGLCGLILSRCLYGLTVSGMVPAVQTWAIQRGGMEKRMSALATISSGLSCGRLLGPPLAAAALGLHPQAPLWLMAVAPLLALLLIAREDNDPPLPPVAKQSAHLSRAMLPYLLLALLLAGSVSLMQIGLSARLQPIFPGSAMQVSHHVALLLSLAAASTLAAQFLVVRPQRLRPLHLLCAAALLMSAGLLLMVLPGLFTLYTGIIVTSLGSAMATPGYQLLLNDRLTTGKGAGAIATSHTLGYGLSALMVPAVTALFGEPMLLGAAMMLSLLFLLLCGALWRHRNDPEF